MRRPKEDFDTLIGVYEAMMKYPLKIGSLLEKQFLGLRQALEIYHGEKFDNYMLRGRQPPKVKYVKKTSQDRYKKFKSIIQKHKVRHWNRMSKKRQIIFDSLELADNITHYFTLTNPMRECLDLPDIENLKGTHSSYTYSTKDYLK